MAHMGGCENSISTTSVGEQHWGFKSGVNSRGKN